jgi:hypothetical protein
MILGERPAQASIPQPEARPVPSLLTSERVHAWHAPNARPCGEAADPLLALDEIVIDGALAPASASAAYA